MPKIKLEEDSDRAYIHCPACDKRHYVTFRRNGSGWLWNQDVNKPTITPSVMFTYPHTVRHEDLTEETDLCHSFVTNGKIQFLADSTHDYKNKTLDLIDV